MQLPGGSPIFVFYKVGSMRSEGDEPIVVAAPIVIAFRKEASGSLIMKIQDHFWPEDLEPAIPVIHDRAHSLLQHLLLLVELSNESDNSGCEILRQILQPAKLTSNRPFRVALLSRTTEQEDASKLSKRNPLSAGEIRVFKPSQKIEAKSWLLALEISGSGTSPWANSSAYNPLLSCL